jgi:hypothetical protein
LTLTRIFENLTEKLWLILNSLALSSWEGIIPEEDLKNVERVAPLMKVFGYKPEVHVGSYDHFISKTSQMLHIAFLGNEIRNAYKPAKPAKKLPPKAVMKPTLAQFVENSEKKISNRKTLSTEL